VSIENEASPTEGGHADPYGFSPANPLLCTDRTKMPVESHLRTRIKSDSLPAKRGSERLNPFAFVLESASVPPTSQCQRAQKREGAVRCEVSAAKIDTCQPGDRQWTCTAAANPPSGPQANRFLSRSAHLYEGVAPDAPRAVTRRCELLGAVIVRPIEGAGAISSSLCGRIGLESSITCSPGPRQSLRGRQAAPRCSG